MQGVTALHRLRVVLRATEPIELHPFPGGELYALLSHAHGYGSGQEPGLPDGVSVEVVERGRARILPGQRWAFAITLLLPTAQASDATDAIVCGLEQAGKKALVRGAVIGGNFTIDGIDDLVAGSAWSPGTALAGLDFEQLIEQGQRALDQWLPTASDEPIDITLDWVGPLRIRHSGAANSSRPYLKPGELSGSRLFHSVTYRWELLGFPPLCPADSPADTLADTPVDSPVDSPANLCAEIPEPNSSIAEDDCLPPVDVIEDHSELVRITYGPTRRRKFHGGILGSQRLRIRDRQALLQLWLGQHLGIGSARRFGHGLYRLRELPPLAEAQPAATLLETALHPAVWSTTSNESTSEGEATGIRSATARRWVAGERQIPFEEIPWQDPAGAAAMLPVLPARWRAIEAALCTHLQPALRRIRDDSGVGHLWHSLPRRIGADHRLLPLDRILIDVEWKPHTLRQRLSAVVADGVLVDLVCALWQVQGPSARWISPLASILYCLFPGECTDAARARGARIVRVSNEPVLHFKDGQAATELHDQTIEVARRIGDALRVAPADLDLGHRPFSVTGIELDPRQRFQPVQVIGPTTPGRNGWHRSRVPAAMGDLRWPIPGESLPVRGSSSSNTLIVGPSTALLVLKSGRLEFDKDEQEGPLVSRLRKVVALGKVGFSGPALDAIRSEGVPVLFTDASGRPEGEILHWKRDHHPDLWLQQERHRSRPDQALNLCRTLIQAKLQNHALVASHLDEQVAIGIQQQIDNLPGAANRSTLMGMEGAAAAFWYRGLRQIIPEHWHFDKRVAPHAKDPVNALMNLLHSCLHRECRLACWEEGLHERIGFLHQDRSGHASLASDLQEPFRHLVDREVMAILDEWTVSDFKCDEEGRSRLSSTMLQQVMARFEVLLDLRVSTLAQETAVSYRQQIRVQARSLRRYLSGETDLFQPFLHHADSGTQSASCDREAVT